ncbi:MAG: 4Fe-4S dicluster domain-containing protein [Eggerthellaceae bacterium]|nr:4Fe-4S dicluster domain-containing protein [Eggerthellaceae bacterium]
MAHYGMLIDAGTCCGCNACAFACKYQNATPHGMYWTKVIFGEVGTYPNARQTVLPLGCQHCTNAPCVRACPTGASHYDENGNVQVDYSRCIGCRMCMGACPYSARQFNWGEPEENTYWGEGFEQTPFEAVRASEHPKGVVEKCIMCKGRVEKGEDPACVATCITKSRWFGDLDDPDSVINQKIRELHARTLLPELGTKPSVYYAGLD